MPYISASCFSPLIYLPMIFLCKPDLQAALKTWLRFLNFCSLLFFFRLVIFRIKNLQTNFGPVHRLYTIFRRIIRCTKLRCFLAFQSFWCKTRLVYTCFQYEVFLYRIMASFQARYILMGNLDTISFAYLFSRLLSLHINLKCVYFLDFWLMQRCTKIYILA